MLNLASVLIRRNCVLPTQQLIVLQLCTLSLLIYNQTDTLNLVTWNVYRPLTPRAKPVNNVFKSVITPKSATFNVNCTATIKPASALGNGVVKTVNRPRPKTAIAPPTVASTSTMMRDRVAAMVIRTTWRFSSGCATSISVERLVGVVAVRGSWLISPVVERMAAVMRLICAPTSADAAVFETRSEEAESGARVASKVIGVSRRPLS